MPQVQLIGNGMVYDHEGLAEVELKHLSHETFHKTRVSSEDAAKGYTRYYRWHMDAALYDLSPPKVTTLYGVTVPHGSHQTVRYDDGTGDELGVPLATTAFVDGRVMFAILPPALKSVAVRARAKYAPHPYAWMAPAHALPTGLGIVSEGLEMAREELPAWEEARVKVHPMVSTARFQCLRVVLSGYVQVWKNPVTGELHFQVHPCGVAELLIDPLPAGASREGALYPDGAHLTDLAEVRDLLYKMQRPAIAPSVSSSPRFCWLHELTSRACPRSWCIPTTGESPLYDTPLCLYAEVYAGARRTSFSSTTGACCTPPSGRSPPTRFARSTSATSQPRMILLAPLQTMWRSGLEGADES